MANRTYELAVQGVENSSYREILLHFQSGGTNDSDTLAASESLCAAFDTSAKTLWLAICPNTYQLVRTQARRVDLKPSATGCKYYGLGNAFGTRPAAATAQQTCPSVFLVPTMGTKSGGRIFLPALAQGDCNQSAYGATYLTAVNSLLSALMSGITAASITWTLAIFSRKLKTTANVVSHSMSPVIGYQGKRRKPIGAV